MSTETTSTESTVAPLTKGMFGGEFGPRIENPRFGLRTGQMNGGWAHNGSWFNQKGEKLGWGDLSETNVVRIANELVEGEMFLVCGESAFWNFVQSFGPIGSMCTTSPDETEPGAKFLSEEAMFVILPGKILRESYGKPSGELLRTVGEIPVVAALEEEFHALLIAGGAKE